MSVAKAAITLILARIGSPLFCVLLVLLNSILSVVNARALPCPVANCHMNVNSISSLFNAHIFSETDWCCQELTCLIVIKKKKSKLLKHLKCHILQISEGFEEPVYLKYISA